MNIRKKLFIPFLLVASVLSGCNSDSNDLPIVETPVPAVPTLPGDAYDSAALEISDARVKYEEVIDAYIFTIEVSNDAGSVAPMPAGQVDGAPVLGYVFVTDLSLEDVGYVGVEGAVALGITSHPDFDDTPLWDEDNNDAYDDDDIVYHSHWVVLEENDLAGEGLAVVQAGPDDILTPTSPMPMYLDSTGFTILEKGREISVIVPVNAVKRNTTFTSNALTAYLEVGIVDNAPLLKVERFYSEPGAPLVIQNSDSIPLSNWPALSAESSDESLNLINTTVDYLEEIDSLIFSMETLAPAAVGFKNIDEGILALAVTTHPDFDDTPLWDENANGDYADDGIVYHTHWVALVTDEASDAGLSVPYTLRVIVPTEHVDNITTFNFDGVTATMNVDATGEGPVLRVNCVIDVQSGDLSLPYTVTEKLLIDFQ